MGYLFGSEDEENADSDSREGAYRSCAGTPQKGGEGRLEERREGASEQGRRARQTGDRHSFLFDGHSLGIRPPTPHCQSTTTMNGNRLRKRCSSDTRGSHPRKRSELPPVGGHSVLSLDVSYPPGNAMAYFGTELTYATKYLHLEKMR